MEKNDKNTAAPAVDQPRLVRHLWIQYGYDDTDNAPIIQSADSEDEARECNDDVMDGCVWYRYDIAPGTKDGSLINPDGPHYLANAGLTHKGGETDE